MGVSSPVIAASDHSIEVPGPQLAYATQQLRPQMAPQPGEVLIDNPGKGVGYECLVLADCTGATEPGNHVAALRMVTMQGAVFGCVATSDAVLAVTTTGDHHAG
jgi:nicotinamidase-related amidase